VFRVSIADKGLSILSFRLKNEVAHLLPFSFLTNRNDLGVDSSTDSITEQRDETNKARNKYTNRSIINISLYYNITTDRLIEQGFVRKSGYGQEIADYKLQFQSIS